MAVKQSRLQRVFGVGPFGSVLSVALLFLAVLLARATPGGWMPVSETVRVVALNVGAVGAFLLIWWSLRTLKPKQRGNVLCTTGPFRFVRHPLYASFLSCFDFGFAIYLGHWAFLCWALALHPLWHWVIRKEERVMEEQFGQAWRNYAARTGRFFPRFRSISSGSGRS
ncbi:MAG: isoprenylcysteine carboxylmethyltransferase family protein [Gammaproteobacteria bacterium]|jgi:protein-S-isoprenylcysteine O-methyltransferase Ste14